MRTMAIDDNEIADAGIDTHLIAEFDHLVMVASEGDRRAIGAIAAALGPALLAQARAGLGDLEQEADDVLQDFFFGLLERRWRFTPGQGRGMRWMCGVIHGMAHLRRGEIERNWDSDTDDPD